MVRGRFHIAPYRLGARGIGMARVVLGLTMYLDDPAFWGREGVTRALDAFLRQAPAARLSSFTTSALSEWRRVDPARGIQALVDALGAWSGSLRDHARHGFFFEIGDEARTYDLGFYYREVDQRRTARAGVLEVTFPQDWTAGSLHDLALELAGIGPFHCGIGGYCVRYDWWWRRHAFTQAYVWCSRFWGIDVQDSELMSATATRAVPGVNWLTLVGGGLADRARFDLSSLSPPQAIEPRDAVDSRRAAIVESVRVIPARFGVVVRAGDVPDDGDVNRMVYPDAYAEAARRLAPLLPTEPPEYVGQFGARRQTKVWMHRFLDPQAWHDRDIG